MRCDSVFVVNSRMDTAGWMEKKHGSGSDYAPIGLE